MFRPLVDTGAVPTVSAGKVRNYNVGIIIAMYAEGDGEGLQTQNLCQHKTRRRTTKITTTYRHESPTHAGQGIAALRPTISVTIHIRDTSHTCSKVFLIVGFLQHID